jgi:hypothetical protein
VWNKLETNLKDISFYNTFKKLIKQHFILNPVTNACIVIVQIIPHKNEKSNYSISLYLNIVNTTVFIEILWHFTRCRINSTGLMGLNFEWKSYTCQIQARNS